MEATKKAVFGLLFTFAEREVVSLFPPIALIIFALFATRHSGGRIFVTTFFETAKVLIISHISQTFLPPDFLRLISNALYHSPSVKSPKRLYPRRSHLPVCLLPVVVCGEDRRIGENETAPNTTTLHLPP